MKRMIRKSLPLRTKLMFLPLSIFFVMSLICAGILEIEYASITDLHDSLETSRKYNYFEAITCQFQTAFSLYTNSFDRKYLNDCLTYLEKLKDTSDQILSDFPADQNVIQSHVLVESFYGYASDLFANGTDLSTSEFLNAVMQIETYLADIKSSTHTLHIPYLIDIEKKSANAIERWHSQMQLCIVAVIVLLVFLLLFANRIIQNIVAPIFRLVYYAKRISAGDFSYRFDPPENADTDEISILTSAFICMSETIAKQMQELQEKFVLAERLHAMEIQNVNIRLSLAEKEMCLMQSIINPHFLFNCLATISSSAILENAPQTQEITNRVARYLRNTINLVGSCITMREEIELLHHYLYIQLLRFGDRIRTDIDCDPLCSDALVPAMFLQPLAENSFVHGFRNCMKNGKVKITVKCHQGEQICIRICDNGCGIDAKRLKELESNIYLPFQSSHKNIGLHSVISQFEIVFKNQYSFKIESTPEIGTTIQIIIPCLTKVKHLKDTMIAAASTGGIYEAEKQI